jgi:hypothetical protein
LVDDPKCITYTLDELDANGRIERHPFVLRSKPEPLYFMLSRQTISFEQFEHLNRSLQAFKNTEHYKTLLQKYADVNEF